VKIFKFGGASVKDAKSIINVTKILKSEGYQDLVLVISAMGKMTNAFEEIVKTYLSGDSKLETAIKFVREFHSTVIDELFDTNHKIYNEIDWLFLEMNQFFIKNKNFNYDYVYDQIVGYGELISTKILSNYLNKTGIDNIWVDVRELLITDNNYRNAKVDWDLSCQNINSTIQGNTLYITQGFIAGTAKKTSTTLGREGSDYSAAIFGYCLQADSLTIWKDVPGVYNADPRFFKQKKLLNQISYKEALEMAFYGASVIHPKTIKPLENRNIPLFVRSFAKPNNNGTIITNGVELEPKIACYTHKENQILLSISTKDFSFIIEENISHLFDLFTKHKIKVNLTQNSAISFSVCIEDTYRLFDKLFKELQLHYSTTYNKNVKLITIRHFQNDDIHTIKDLYDILLTQQTSKTIQFVVK
jgi:aspartate kinase